MGQENEQQAELIATIQHDHSAMKKWYSSHGDAKILHNLYGSVYPAFWKDVVDWKHEDQRPNQRRRSLASRISFPTHLSHSIVISALN